MTLAPGRAGHSELNAQHEAIVPLVAALRDAVVRCELHAARAAVEALWDASVSRFAMEQALMDQHGYPERNQHRTAHHLFLEDLGALVRAVTELGLTDEVARWAGKRVPDWIAFHVETNDAPLARYLARRAATGSGGQRPRDA